MNNILKEYQKSVLKAKKEQSNISNIEKLIIKNVVDLIEEKYKNTNILRKRIKYSYSHCLVKKSYVGQELDPTIMIVLVMKIDGNLDRKAKLFLNKAISYHKENHCLKYEDGDFKTLIELRYYINLSDCINNQINLQVD